MEYCLGHSIFLPEILCFNFSFWKKVRASKIVLKHFSLLPIFWSDFFWQSASAKIISFFWQIGNGIYIYRCQFAKRVIWPKLPRKKVKFLGLNICYSIFYKFYPAIFICIPTGLCRLRILATKIDLFLLNLNTICLFLRAKIVLKRGITLARNQYQTVPFCP